VRRAEESGTETQPRRRGARSLVSTVHHLRVHWRPHFGRLALAAVAGVGYVVATLLEPWPIQILFDGVLLGRKIEFLGVDVLQWSGGNPTFLLGLCVLAIVTLAALRGQLYYLQNVAAATVGQDVVTSLRRHLFEHLQSLSLSYHRRGRVGDLLTRLTGDIVMMREMVVAALVSLLSQGLVLVGILTVMALIDWRLTLVAVTVAPALYALLSLFRRRLVRAAKRQRKREGELVSSAQEVLQSIHLVQANTAERHEKERFAAQNRRAARAGIQSTRLEAQLHRGIQVTVALGVGATLGFGALGVLEGRMSPGQLLVFLAYVRGLYGPMRQLSKVVQRTSKASACAERVLEVLEERPEIRSTSGAPSLRVTEGRIEVRGVSFGYDPGRPVLREIDLVIEPRSNVALVGPTGAGKSTLLNLIPRFFDPQLGEIRIDGAPIRKVSVHSLRHEITYLTQEVVVLGLTVRENIAYGAIGRGGSLPDSRKIEWAARAAHAHEFIMKLPYGYDTVVSERGASLSGGQRQRIAIARALLRDASILLFDEPMTGLDPESERLVREAFLSLTHGRTTVMVAHHLQTVVHADRIVFLEDGRVVESGTHEELVHQGGPYERFYRTQWAEPGRGARDRWTAHPSIE
jgi:ATP-binding cassette subfamily B protein